MSGSALCSSPREVPVGSRFTVVVGGNQPLCAICGPCVIEGREMLLRHAEAIKEASRMAGVPLIFKSSYDKANRTSGSGYRGVGIELGLKLLSEVRDKFEVPVVTDIHSPEEAKAAAQAVDLLQIPAFLCRQTDLLHAAGETGRPVMIKKGQFLDPHDMEFAAEKAAESGNDKIILCERGSCFGYRELVVDFRGLKVMANSGRPVIFDATHSVQVMGGAQGRSGGNREYVAVLARAAAAVGVSGVFLESHLEPDLAPSDGPNMLPVSALADLLLDVKRIAELPLLTK